MRRSFSLMLTIALLFSVSASFGQGYTFRVLANKGTNQVKKSGSAAPVALKTGSTLNAGDELIVGSGSYIGLMHKTGKTIEVRDAGNQSVSDLEKKVAAKNTSVASKYANYLAAKMNDDGTKSYASRMNATGAVSRATGSNAIDVMLPADGTINVLGDNAIVRWNAPEESEEEITYLVTVKNIFDQVIYEGETTKQMVELNFDEIENESELYIFSVANKNDEEVASGNYGIKRVTPGDMMEVETNYKGLQEEVSEDSPLNKLIYASFFEENGLLLDALTMYEEAIKMSPEVEDFQELYQVFLVNNGIVQ